MKTLEQVMGEQGLSEKEKIDRKIEWARKLCARWAQNLEDWIDGIEPTFNEEAPFWNREATKDELLDAAERVIKFDES